MKMSRLPSTTQQATPEAAERAALAQAGSVRRVEPMEGVVNERERSLQQDMAEVDPRAVGPYQGVERRRQQADQLARRLVDMGSDAVQLLRFDTRARRPGKIDEKA